MEFTPADKELLIRAFSFYYKHHVWGKMADEDNSKASDEDYKIRTLSAKLQIKGMFSDDIASRW